MTRTSLMLRKIRVVAVVCVLALLAILPLSILAYAVLGGLIGGLAVVVALGTLQLPLLWYCTRSLRRHEREAQDANGEQT